MIRKSPRSLSHGPTIVETSGFYSMTDSQSYVAIVAVAVIGVLLGTWILA